MTLRLYAGTVVALVLAADALDVMAAALIKASAFNICTEARRYREVIPISPF